MCENKQSVTELNILLYWKQTVLKQTTKCTSQNLFSDFFLLPLFLKSAFS